MPEVKAADPDFFVIFMNTMFSDMAFDCAFALRKAGFVGHMSQGGSFKSQIRQADKLNARFTIIIGEDEFKNDKVAFKDMSSGEQVIISKANLVSHMTEVLK